MTENTTQGFYETSKEYYKRLLLQTIMEHGPVNRRQLSELLHLRPATQKRFLVELLAAGLIREAGNVIVRRGRGAIQLTVNPHGGRFIGLSLDAHRIRGVVCSFDLSVLRTEELPVESEWPSARILNALIGVIRKLRKASDKERGKLWGIGYGEYGLLDMQQGIALRSTSHRHWRGIPVMRLLSEEFGVPVNIESRERCSLLSERIWGEAQDADTVVWVEVNDGIGMALLYRGEVISGANGLAGEIGHMRVVRDGDLCTCGGYGCLETVAGARAVTHRVAQAIRQGVHSEIRLKKGESLSIAHVTCAALNGDRLADKVLSGAVYHLGVALGNVINLINPDTVILQGEIFRHGGARLVEQLQREAASVALGELQEKINWRVSNLEDPIPKGAAALAFENLFGVGAGPAQQWERTPRSATTLRPKQ